MEHRSDNGDTRPPPASSSDVALVYMKTMSSRMDRAETEFVDHIHKVDLRLDQVTEVVRDVSVLQQQNTAQSESIAELRLANREQTQRLEGTVGRIHVRIDELDSSVTAAMEAETAKVMEKIGEVSRERKDLDKRFQMWLNRGIGGWVVAVIVVGLMQYVGMKWLDNLQQERDAAAERVQKLTNRVIDLENRYFQQFEKQP